MNTQSLPSLQSAQEGSGIMSRIMTAGGHLGSNKLLLAVGLLLFAVVAGFYYYYYVAKKGTKYHHNSEPEGSRNAPDEAEVFLFYATWCPHCKVAKPIFNEVAEEFNGKIVNGHKLLFTPVDCSEETTENAKLMDRFNVEGFPTIKLVKDGQIIEYDAKPNRDTLIQFLETVTK